MYLGTSKAQLDGQATAGALVVGTDLHTQDAGTSRVLVLALSMKGLRWLVLTYGMTPPPEDTAILQANLLAVLAAKGVAWAQT